MQKRHSLSISAFYFVYFFGYGALFPFLALILQGGGRFSGTEIGLLLSLNPILSIVAQPLWGLLCDVTQKPKAVLGATVWLTALAGLTLLQVTGFSFVVAVAALSVLAIVQSAAMPLIDSLTMAYATRAGKEYGSFGLWGAAGFAVSVFVVGKLSDMYGLELPLFSFIAATVLSGILTLLLPNEAAGFRVSLRANLKVLLRLPRYSVFLLASFLIFGPMLSNNYYFGILMKDAGGSLTGLGIAFLIAAGSEIPFMRWSERFVERWGLLAVLIACSSAAGVRWLLYGFELPLPVIYATTVLQGFGIGLFIPAALLYVYRVSPEGVRATAVSLYSMAGNGLGNWICTLIGGALLNRYTIHAAYVSFTVSTALGIALLVLLTRMQRSKQA